MVTITPLNTMLDRMVTLSRAMDQAFVNGSPDTLGKTAAQPVWVPELDAWETESDYLVQLDLPGVKAESVDIGFEKNTLTIRGEKRIDKEEKGKTWFRREIAGGKFTRSFTLPASVDAEHVESGIARAPRPGAAPAAEIHEGHAGTRARAGA